MDEKYPNVRAKRISIKFGPTVLLTIRKSESTTIQTFLPERYSDVVSDYDIDKINRHVVSLNPVYKGMCEKS